MRLLLADDHELIRTGLANTLVSILPEVEIIEAASGLEALSVLETQAPFEIAIVDLFMPNMDGFSFLRKLCNSYPDLPVIVLSSSTNPEHIRKSLDIGVSGYITKSSPQSVLEHALKLVRAGGVYIPPDALTRQVSNSDKSELVSGAVTLENLNMLLTERQIEILRHLARGNSNKLIARECNLSENTVKVHVSAVLKALNMTNRAQAGIFAEKIGLPFNSEEAEI